MIYSLLIWIGIVIGEAFFHAEMFKRGIKPVYWQWAIVRGMTAILHGIFCDIINKEYDLVSMNEYYPLLIFQISSHYLIFDPFLSWLRKLPWDYRGEDSGYLDKLPLPLYYGLKVLCVGLLIYSTVMLL